jgi:hypothetical protein
MLDEANYLLSLEQPPQTLLNTAFVGVESEVFEGVIYTPQMAMWVLFSYVSWLITSQVDAQLTL